MRRAILVFPFFMGMFLFTSAQKAKIDGKLDLAEPAQKVILAYTIDGERITDSADITKGKFNFNAPLKEPVLATLMVRMQPKEEGKRPGMERMQLYIEPGKIKIAAKDSLKFARVSGSKSNKSFDKYNEMLKPYNEKGTQLNSEFRKYAADKNEDGMKKVREEFNVLNDEKEKNVTDKFLQENPSSVVSLYVLGQKAGYDLDPAVIEPLFNNLSEKVKSSGSGIAFREKIETAKKTAVGAMAMNFTQNDTLDKPVSLSDFRGKYVLVDFWASWCGPCRAENPNVVKAFNNYKDKNFTVLGVSLDQPGAKQAWMDAIHKDELWWTQVSDLKFWENEVAKQYGIRAIPQNFLIDPNGKIIAKNIRGEALNDKLKEILD